MPARDVQREADDVKILRQWGCLTLTRFFGRHFAVFASKLGDFF